MHFSAWQSGPCITRLCTRSHLDSTYNLVRSKSGFLKCYKLSMPWWAHSRSPWNSGSSKFHPIFLLSLVLAQNSHFDYTLIPLDLKLLPVHKSKCNFTLFLLPISQLWFSHIKFKKLGRVYPLASQKCLGTDQFVSFTYIAEILLQLFDCSRRGISIAGNWKSMYWGRGKGRSDEQLVWIPRFFYC